MYSGTTLTKYSGRILGAHQKINRISRRQLNKLITNSKLFPSIKPILHFEGKNGPDAIKRKSPAQDEPWHYFDPFNDKDGHLLELIDNHYENLVNELKAKNHERAAFEAAWLSHAIVDGLTPAHHFPYEEKLIEIRGGKGIETRTSIKDKIVQPGHNRRETLSNNWKMWGPKGLLTTHGLFEFGLSTILFPLKFGESQPTNKDLLKVEKIGITEWFKLTAKEVAVLDMYETYYQKGWTSKLAYQVRHKLGPAIVQSVTLAWYMSLVDSGLVKPAKTKK